MLCRRCGGSGGLLRKVITNKLRVVTCTTCGGMGIKHKPKEFYKELAKHKNELGKM